MTDSNKRVVNSHVSDYVEPTEHISRIECINNEVERLAKLSDVEYQLENKMAAENLELTVSGLKMLVNKAKDEAKNKAQEEKIYSERNALFPEVKPWDEEVDGAILLDNIVYMLKRYTVITEEFVIATTLWIAFTWFHERASISPILYINSPVKRCGKSTLLSFIMRLVFRYVAASNISPASIYRAVDEWSPTLLIDEADSFLSKNSAFQAIINGGHNKAVSSVIRCEGDDNVPTKFSTWCAKVIAGIGVLDETIMDRSINIEMRRKQPSQDIENIRHADDGEFDVISRKLARWSNDNLNNFDPSRPDPVSGINDRANDNWESLMVIAELAGGEWPERARNAATLISGAEDDELSLGERLLTDILHAFKDKGVDRLATHQILSCLCSDDEKPWASWNRGKSITAFQLSKLLKIFKISSKSIRFDVAVKKGYFLVDFDDVASRYAISKP